MIGVGGEAKKTRRETGSPKNFFGARVRAEIKIFNYQKDNKISKHSLLQTAHCGGPMLKMSKPP